MDREPKPAPFPVGSMIRYVGTRRSWTERGGKRIPNIEPGMLAEIVETHSGIRGTLRQRRDADGPMFWDDTGDPILDETSDGRSVYVSRSGMRCAIFPDSAHEWALEVRDGRRLDEPFVD